MLRFFFQATYIRSSTYRWNAALHELLPGIELSEDTAKTRGDFIEISGTVFLVRNAIDRVGS